MKLLLNSENEPVIQGTDSWHIAKKNRFSASKISKLITDNTKRSKDAAYNYVISKAYGTFLETPIITPQSFGMRRGTLLESEARLEFLHQYNIVSDDCTINQIDEDFNVGKCYLDDECEFHLISPDGWNEKQNFGTEFKVAETIDKYARFCRNVIDNETFKAFDTTYYWQVMDALMCSGADYWWFCYYLPEMQRGYDVRAIKILPNKEDFAILRLSINTAMEIYKEAYLYELNKQPKQ